MMSTMFGVQFDSGNRKHKYVLFRTNIKDVFEMTNYM
jgi:hypothetical protein